MFFALVHSIIFLCITRAERGGQIHSLTHSCMDVCVCMRIVLLLLYQSMSIYVNAWIVRARARSFLSILIFTFCEFVGRILRDSSLLGAGFARWQRNNRKILTTLLWMDLSQHRNWILSNKLVANPRNPLMKICTFNDKFKWFCAGRKVAITERSWMRI